MRAPKSVLIGAVAGVVLLMAACTPAGHSRSSSTVAPKTSSSRASGGATLKLNYLGTQRMGTGSEFEGTAVGGLSGISYDARTGKYYVISDDRSVKNPARFYTATLKISASHFDSAKLTDTKPFRRQDGTTFPPTTGTIAAPDPEGIAVDPRTGQLFWSSEGERTFLADGTPVLADPAVRVSTTTGRYVRRLPIPAQLEMSTQKVGPRRNQTLEGLSFTPDGKKLYATMEDPLYQDGADPTPTSGALNRVTEYSASTLKPVAQYAYPIEKLFQTPPNADSTATNGVSDALALGDGRLLVIERAVVVDTFSWKIRLYLADTAGATNVLNRRSLQTGGAVRPMHKHLLLDLDDVPGLQLDNVEGATLGPRLPDGRRVLVLVTDNNFTWAETTEFLAFAVSGF